jgi:hypothetical protein
MLLHVRWQATPRLVPLAVVTALPAVVLWTAALVEALGVGRPLNLLAPTPAIGRVLAAILVVGPLLAAGAAALALADAEVRVEHWELTARLRMPPPPWRAQDLIAAVVLVLGGVLFVAMAGHLAADCALAGDCAWR